MRAICYSPIPIFTHDDVPQEIIRAFLLALEKFVNKDDSLTEIPASVVDDLEPIANRQSSDFEQNLQTYAKVTGILAEYLSSNRPQDVELSGDDILVFTAMRSRPKQLEVYPPHPKPEPQAKNQVVKASPPIITKLRNQLQHSSHPHDDRTILSDSIDLLETSIHNCIEAQLPDPLFRRVWLSGPILQLVKKRDYFALRILFVFASLCLLLRIQFMNEINVWIEYLEWFKNYSLTKCHNEFDTKLYDLVLVDKFHLRKVDALAEFDPDLVQRRL